MDVKSQLTQFYKSLQQSTAEAKLLIEDFSRLRIALIGLEHEKAHELNESVLKRTESLTEQDKLRYQIAQSLGCSEEKYAEQLIRKLSGATQKQMAIAYATYRTTMLECNEKMEEGFEMTMMQKEVLDEAIESFQINVRA